MMEGAEDRAVERKHGRPQMNGIIDSRVIDNKLHSMNSEI